MASEGDTKSPRELQLQWEPPPLKHNGHLTGRFLLFEDWVSDFVARTGQWPGGPYLQTAQELDDVFSTLGWDLGLRDHALRLSAAEEFDDRARFVPAKRLVRALRRTVKRVSYYVMVGCLPKPATTEKNELVWKFDDIEAVLLLAERIEDVFQQSDFVKEGPLESVVTFLAGKDLTSRQLKQQFVAANVAHLSDWQLEKVYRIVFNGPKEEMSELPMEAPRRWRDRSPAERVNGKSFVSPSAFIVGVWGPWLERGLLSESELELRDPELAASYHRWAINHPEDRLEKLARGRTPLEKRVFGITPETPWKNIETVALAVVKARQRRLKRLTP